MRLLLVGPSLDLITGQAVAFNYLLNNNFPHIYNSGGKTSMGKLVKLISYFFYLPMLIAFYRPHVVYLTNSRTTFGFIRDLYLFSIARLLSIKVIVHLHGSDLKSFVECSGRMRALINWGYKAVSSAIVLSEGMKEQFDSFPHIKVYVVRNCAPSSSFNFSKNKLEKSFRILYLSNLMKTKGVIELVQAVKQLNKMGRDVELRLAGKYLTDYEMESSELENIVKSLLDSKITYHGIVSGLQKSELLDWSNCVALPSYYRTEAQPLTLIEAMAAGRYVLSSKAGYISEFVGHLENGFLLEEVEVSSIVNAINAITEDSEEFEKTTKKNKCYAAKAFAVDRYIEQILDIARKNV